MSTDPTPRTLPDFWDSRRNDPYLPTVLPSLRESSARRLSPVERATVRVSALPPGAVPPGRSVLLESAFRLALFSTRGDLVHMSGARLAEHLEYVFFGSHPSRHSVRGWELLSLISRLGYGEVLLDAEPSQATPFRFRKMKLHERLDELGALTTT